MRTKFKPWTIPYLQQHNDIAISIDNFDDFVFKNCIYLEIGCGKGDFICQMALKFPDIQFIGVEKNITCAGISAKKIVDQKIKNAFVIAEDVEKLFPLLKKESIDGILLNFSDPWPKKRHAKRRLTDTRFIDNYYSIIKKGGILNFKTDNRDLFDFSVKMFSKSKFSVLKIDENYSGDDYFDAKSEYETNFRNQGLIIYKLYLKKE